MLSDDDSKSLRMRNPVMSILVDPAKDNEVIKLGALMGRKSAQEITDFIAGYQDMIQERIASVKPEDRPRSSLNGLESRIHCF